MLHFMSKDLSLHLVPENTMCLEENSSLWCSLVLALQWMLIEYQLFGGGSRRGSCFGFWMKNFPSDFVSFLWQLILFTPATFLLSFAEGALEGTVWKYVTKGICDRGFIWNRSCAVCCCVPWHLQNWEEQASRGGPYCFHERLWAKGVSTGWRLRQCFVCIIRWRCLFLHYVWFSKHKCILPSFQRNLT